MKSTIQFNKGELTVTTNPAETITAENVQRIGELIAFRALKTVMKYSGAVLDDLYYGLIRDMHRSGDVNYIYSDGYDIAQTAICFLCEYMGKKLGDETGKYRDGKPVTVKHACYTVVDRYIRQSKLRLYKNTCIDDLLESETPLAPDLNADETVNTRAIEILEKMKLTDRDYDILYSRLDGNTFRETAQLLSRNAMSICSRICKLKKKYMYLITG